MSTRRTVAVHHPRRATTRRLLGRVGLELQHRELLAEAARLLALAELELERWGAALAEDDHRRRLAIAELTT